MKTMQLYLAGPLFTLAERTYNKELARYFRDLGYKVFNPQEHEPREFSTAAIFKSDADGLAESDMVVACMDGPDPDSGTAWEMGYAYAMGIPVLAYRTDFRGVGEAGACGFNTMMWESSAIKLMLPCLSPAFKSVPLIVDIIDEHIKKFTANAAVK